MKRGWEGEDFQMGETISVDYCLGIQELGDMR